MKLWATLSAAAVLAVTAAIPFSFACGTGFDPSAPASLCSPSALNQTALEAVGEDSAKANAAIKALRADGYVGLNALLALDPKTPRLHYAINHVAMQKDAAHSKLFWHTDFEAAKTEAAKTGKPILTLRMLGNLHEDLSCANSRFFRTTLYANKEISDRLREHFILHWESVRPVPVVTIDMGDGRKIVRTITGNSIHYVLDSKGRVVDGIPGLYGPKAFLAQIKQAESLAGAVKDLDDNAFVVFTRRFHEQQIEQIKTNWQNDLNQVMQASASGSKSNEVENALFGVGYDKPTGVPGAAPPAAKAARTTEAKWKAEAPIVRVAAANARQEAPPPKAGRRALAADAAAVSKSAGERPILRQLTTDLPVLEQKTDDANWTKIAALHAEDAKLDADTLKLVRAKAPPALAEAAGKAAFAKRLVEDPMLKMIRNLQSSIALDTVKNEYRFHPQIAIWLAQSRSPANLKVLNERVYAELFLTPSTDPWLGLAPADAYAALDNGGVCTPEVASR
jgi:hypothetical protein